MRRWTAGTLNASIFECWPMEGAPWIPARVALGVESS
jgi:hypothetical protein